jgi:glycosyltransferase involved in cell wall biosynthesis
MQSRLKLRLLRRLLRGADRAIANSPQGAEQFTRLGLTADRVAIVGNGVPLDRIQVRSTREALRAGLGIALDAPVVVSGGRADDAKDLPTLIAAMEAVRRERPDAVLLAVGPTPADLAALGARAAEGSIAVGWQTNAVDFMAAADVVAISSWTEGHSNVADEALLLGLPVATTDTGGHVALVEQSGGAVVPVRDGAALGRAILQMAHNPPDRAHVASYARAQLSPDAMVDKTATLYDQITGGLRR